MQLACPFCFDVQDEHKRIPVEAMQDWLSIDFALSQLNKQITDFIAEAEPVESTPLIGELVEVQP